MVFTQPWSLRARMTTLGQIEYKKGIPKSFFERFSIKEVVIPIIVTIIGGVLLWFLINKLIQITIPQSHSPNTTTKKKSKP